MAAATIAPPGIPQDLKRFSVCAPAYGVAAYGSLIPQNTLKQAMPDPHGPGSTQKHALTSIIHGERARRDSPLRVEYVRAGRP
jgi:hypothetical protein